MNGVGCTEQNYHEENSKMGYNGVSGIGNQNSCLKFYAFLDDGSEKINLLLDHNTTAVKEWINQEDFNLGNGKLTDFIKEDSACKYGNICVGNNVGPITLLKQLYEDTKLWSSNIKTPNDYIIFQKNQMSEANYTIKYSDVSKLYKARLITADEIAKITGADKFLNWNELSSFNSFYFDGANSTDEKWNTSVANSTNKSEYYWLYDRTRNCLERGCYNEDSETYGYWTATAKSDSSKNAWIVYNHGGLSNNSIDINVIHAGGAGIRPVIQVLKSDI